jgi:hypothetical protein
MTTLTIDRQILELGVRADSGVEGWRTPLPRSLPFEAFLLVTGSGRTGFQTFQRSVAGLLEKRYALRVTWAKHLT